MSLARFLFSWWSPDQVVKKDGSLLMTAKAYNGRCILEWLHDALLRLRSSGTFSDERVPLACMCLSFWCVYWQNSRIHYPHPKRNQNFFQTKHFILWFIAVFIGLCHQSIRNVWEPCRMPWHVSTFVSVISTLKYRLGMVCFQAALRFSSVTVDRSVCCARYMSCRTWYFAITCDVWIPKQGSN